MLRLLPLALALVPLALFALLVQRRVRSWWLLLPLAAATGCWCTRPGCTPRWPVCCSGSWCRWSAGWPGRALGWRSTSSTVSGRCRRLLRCRCSPSSPPESQSSARARCGLTDSVTLGIVVGLVVGKTIGVLGSTWLVHDSPCSACRGAELVGRLRHGVAADGGAGRPGVYGGPVDRGASVAGDRGGRPRWSSGGGAAGVAVLRVVVPDYVREDPALARVVDEAGAERLCCSGWPTSGWRTWCRPAASG